MRISDWSSDVCSSDLSAATPDLSNKPPSCVSSLAAATAFAFWRRSKLSHTSFQLPRVAAFEYSVARVSKRSEERRVGKECVIRVDLGGRRIFKKKIHTQTI